MSNHPLIVELENGKFALSDLDNIVFTKYDRTKSVFGVISKVIDGSRFVCLLNCSREMALSSRHGFGELTLHSEQNSELVSKFGDKIYILVKFATEEDMLLCKLLGIV